MLEKIARDKHSSLLGTLVNYRPKKFYIIGPRFEKYGTDQRRSLLNQVTKTFYGRNLQIFVMSQSVFRQGWKGLPRTNTLALYENL